MFADSRTNPTKFQVGAWRQLQYLRNMPVLVVSDERGDGVLFVERSSELILHALG